MIFKRLWGSLPCKKNTQGEHSSNFSITSNHNPMVLALFCQMTYWPISVYKGKTVDKFLLTVAKREKTKETACIDYKALIKTLSLGNWRLQEYADFPPMVFNVLGFRKSIGARTAICVFVNDIKKEAVVAFRGTNSIRQLIVNDVLRGIILSDTPPEVGTAIEFVHSLYYSKQSKQNLTGSQKRQTGESAESQREKNQLRQYLAGYLQFAETTLNSQYSLYLTGHSLGGHLAQVAAWSLLENKRSPDPVAVDVFNAFAYPTSRSYLKGSSISPDVKKHVITPEILRTLVWA